MAVNPATASTRPDRMFRRQLDDILRRLGVVERASSRGTAAGGSIISGKLSVSLSNVAAQGGTLVYGVTFEAAPVVLGTVQVGANFDLVLNWQSSPTTTQVAFRVATRSGSAGTVTAIIHWLAIGTLA